MDLTSANMGRCAELWDIVTCPITLTCDLTSPHVGARGVHVARRVLPFGGLRNLRRAPSGSSQTCMHLAPVTCDDVDFVSVTWIELAARIDGLRASLSVLAVIALIALFFSRRIPTQQPSATHPTLASADPQQDSGCPDQSAVVGWDCSQGLRTAS